MDQHPRMQKPGRIYSADGRWELIPDVEIYRVTTLDPETPEQAETTKKLGHKIRVYYCAKTYDMATERVKALLARGVRGDRIETVFAYHDTVRAIMSGKFEIRRRMSAEEGQ